MLDLAFVLIITTLVAWSISLTIERKIAMVAGNFKAAILVVGLGIIPILVLFLSSSFGLSAQDSLNALLAGIFLAFGYLLYYKALETEQVSNTAGIGLAQPAILLVFGIVALHQLISMQEALGGAIILAGVFLISTNSKFELNWKLLPAFLANVSWAIYWIFASYAILSSQQVGATMLIARVTSFALIILMFAFIFKSSAPKIKPQSFSMLLVLAIIAGLLDGTGNVTFGYVVQLKELSLGSIFNALQPLLVAALAYVVYKEKLSKLQKVGLLGAVIGAIILSLG